MLRNGLYNVVGQTIRGAVGLLTIPFLIRFLGIREYGVWSLAYAVLGIMLLGEAGISVAAAVFLSGDLAGENRNEASWTLGFVLGSGLFMSVAVGLLLWFSGRLIVQPLAAFTIRDRLVAARAVQIAGIAAAAFIFERILVGIEQAFDRYGTVNTLDVSQSLLANVGLIVVAWLGGRTVALMEWQVLAWAVFLAAHCYFVFRLLRSKKLRPGWNFAKARKIFHFTIATWASVAGSAAFSQCDRLIVGGILGAPVLGIYSAITNITSKINSFSGTAVQPLVPSLSRGMASNTSQEKHIQQAVHLNSLIAIEGGICLFVLADLVMRVMVPGASTPADILGLQIAAVIYALYSCNAPGYFILFALGEARQNAIVTLSSAGVSLALIFIGAHYFGFLGAIGGNAGYLGSLLMVGLGNRKVGITLRRYASWVALPIAAFALALLAGPTMGAHLLWRVLFVGVQGALLLYWFLHSQGGVRFAEAIGRPFGV